MGYSPRRKTIRKGPDVSEAPTVTLADCPTGLFWFNGTLGFKSEYATLKEENGVAVGVQCDAYVVSSGEYFWGGVSDWRQRDKLMVTPIDFDETPFEFFAPHAYMPAPDED